MIVLLLIMDLPNLQIYRNIYLLDVEPQDMLLLKLSISKIWKPDTVLSVISLAWDSSFISLFLERVFLKEKLIIRSFRKIEVVVSVLMEENIRKLILLSLILWRKCWRRTLKRELLLKQLWVIPTSEITS